MPHNAASCSATDMQGWSWPPPPPPPPLLIYPECLNGLVVQTPSPITNAPAQCIMCPPHFNCSATNHTFLEDADLIPGYWRSGPQSVKAIACHGIDRCLGLGPGDAACTPGSNLSGLRCDVCPSGQYFVDRTLTCTECTPHQITLSILFLALLFALSAIAPIVFITCWERLRCRGYTASKTNDQDERAFRDQAQLDSVRKTLSGPPSESGREELSRRSELSKRSEFSKMLSVYDLRSGSEEKSMSAGDKLRACARIAIGLLRADQVYARAFLS